MLNHATARVNESEHERALSEVEHRQTTAIYHRAEHDVQRLQKELKRAIAKSRYAVVYLDIGTTFNVLQNLDSLISNYFYIINCSCLSHDYIYLLYLYHIFLLEIISFLLFFFSTLRPSTA